MGDPVLEALKEFQDSLGELARECEKLADELASTSKPADYYADMARENAA